MKLQREQVVAAGLVGTVVVVLGFASGIGVPPNTESVAGQPSPKSPQTGTTSQRPPATAPPMAHVGQAIPQPVGHVSVPTANPARPTHSTPATTHPHPPTTPPTTTTPPKPEEPCDAGAIATLLRQVGALVGDLPLLSDLTGRTGDLAVLGDATSLAGQTGGLPLVGDLTELLSPLGGLLGGSTTTLPTAELTGLLGGSCGLLVDKKTSQVTGLFSTGTP